MTHHRCDVAIIGAGTAGLAAERSARRAGADTLLIDEAFAGTTCATVGCMPSKLLIAAAENAHRARQTEQFGVHCGDIRIDGRQVMKRVQKLRDHFVSATKEGFDELPEGTCIMARARFTGRTTLALDNGDTVEARAIIVATGSAPRIPGPFEGLGDRVLTNRSVFELDDLPGSLAVVGGGSIGLELAQAFARLDVRVSVFETSQTIGGVEDEAVQQSLQSVLGEEFALHLGVEVSATRNDDGVSLSWNGDSEGQERFDRVLVAAGRVPRIDGLDFEKTGLELDDKGMPDFDRATMQCGDAPIFFAGDCDGDEPVLHMASEEGAIAGYNAVAWPAVGRSHRSPVFRITFTDPPIAIVGEVSGDDMVSGCASYAEQGRATVEGRATGLAKLYAKKKCGSLLGATLFVPGADHMAHLLHCALERRMTVSELKSLPRYHPTLEEGLSGALGQLCSDIGPPTPGDEDQGTPPGA